MSIFPLPVFEAELEAARRDAEEYARLSVPKTMVVRFGLMKLIGEYPYDGDAKPGCGSKIVVRTHRGTELGEMLTSTCPNAGCSKSVTRKEMLEYIENSGGKDYPFHTEGRALGVATIEDLNRQSALDAQKPQMLRTAREEADLLRLPMKIVDVEPILGGERLTFYFTSEDRVDFRELVQSLARHFHTRIELRQVGARDEARLIADYEKCGQHCCCKQFLKVLKPVSIKAAKTQKATLDPLKISGRCGRLMCCLRYEDQTYDELSARLPKMKKRVGTPQGDGVVVDRQILTQLVLVRLDADGTEVAVPVEDISAPGAAAPVAAPNAPISTKPTGSRDRRPDDPLRGMTPEQVRGKIQRGTESPRDRQGEFRERSKSVPPPKAEQVAPPSPIEQRNQAGPPDSDPALSGESGEGKKKRRRRRRKPRPDGAAPGSHGGAAHADSIDAPRPAPQESERGEGPEGPTDDPARRKRRRRRRRKGPPQGGGGGGGAASPPAA